MNEEALKTAAEASLACESGLMVPAALTLAQWALESGWGEHCPGNNCFGIKAFEHASGKQLLRTSGWFAPSECAHWLAQEQGRTAVADRNTPGRPGGGLLYHCQDWFAAFDSLRGCFMKHGTLISSGKPYGHAWERFLGTRDAEQLARDIAPLYATDPGYASTLIGMMRSPRIRAAIATQPFLEKIA